MPPNLGLPMTARRALLVFSPVYLDAEERLLTTAGRERRGSAAFGYPTLCRQTGGNVTRKVAFMAVLCETCQNTFLVDTLVGYDF